MFDFKTFAQMNLDCIFQGFDRLPALGEEVFAKSFTLQLGGGPMVCPIVLNQLGCKTELGTFLGEGDVTAICLRLLERKGFHAFRSFPSPKKDPVVVTAVFSGPGDRGFLAHNEQVYESCLPEDVVFTNEFACVVLCINAFNRDQLARVKFWIIVKHEVESNGEFCFFDCHN